MLSSSYSSSGFVINTNLASLIVQQNLLKATNDMATYMERLSTGLKVNRASDDPSGMSIATSYSAQINSTNVAKNNCQTGASLLQTAEGDLDTIQQNLSDMKDLIIQAKTGTTSQAQRDAFNATYQQLLDEIDRVANSSNYSGIKLLDGTNGGAGSIVLQIDIQNTATHKLDISSVLTGVDKTDLGINATVIDSVTAATAAQALVEAAYNTVTTQIASVGAFVDRLNDNVTRLDTRNTNMQAARSLITDTDVAAETAKLTRSQILQQTSAALIQQANQTASLIFTLIGS